MWQVESAGFRTIASYTAQVLAVVRELLDAVVGRAARPDAVLSVHTRAMGPPMPAYRPCSVAVAQTRQVRHSPFPRTRGASLPA